MSESARSAAEVRFFGLDVVEWSVGLVGSVLIGLAAWIV
jgi:hypothetical protein